MQLYSGAALSGYPLYDFSHATTARGGGMVCAADGLHHRFPDTLPLPFSPPPQNTPSRALHCESLGRRMDQGDGADPLYVERNN